MAAPVWVLSVDLQAKTASFTTGLADAARSARGSFTDIKNSAADMGDGVTRSTTNMRAGLGLVNAVLRGESTRAIADLAREYQNSAVVMAALPIATTVAGFAAVLMVVVEVAKKIREYREEQEKLAQAGTVFGTAVQESFNSLDDKLIQAEKRTDELRNDHLGALKKELELIDHASMADLVKEFDLIAKAADVVFKGLEGHWYNLGSGTEGALHALEQFGTQYKSLLAVGNDKEASDLLHGTLSSAQRIADLQQQAIAAKSQMGGRDGAGDADARTRFYSAVAELKKAGIDYDGRGLAIQQQVLKTLNDQVKAEQKIAAIKNQDGANAGKQTGNEAAARASEAAKQAAASRQAIAEAQLAASKSLADAQLTITNAGIAARLASDMAFEQKDLSIKLAGNQAQIAALNRTGADYNNQLKALHEKSEELTAQSAAKIAELQSRATVEQSKKDIADFEAAERAKLQATQEVSAVRLSVLDQVMKQSEAKGLQETEFYRSLGQQRIEIARRISEETKKQQAEAGKEEADNLMRLAQIQLAADVEAQQLINSRRRLTDQQRLAQATDVANREFAIKLAANLQEQAALDSSDQSYENKLKSLQNKEVQLIREHENQVTSIKTQAEIERNQKIQAAEQKYENDIASGLTRVLMGQQSFTAMMRSLGAEVVSDLMQMEIKHIEANLMSKQSDAAAAARKAYLAGLGMGGPAGVILGPIYGAAAYAGMMAFSSGTESVPGIGNRDTVPALLTPGEGVVTGPVMDGLKRVAQSGGFTSGPSMSVRAHFAPRVQAFDAAGVDKVLTKHGDKFQKHIESTLRKMNR